MGGYDAGVVRGIKRLAARIRRDTVEMIGCDGGTGHLGGSCSSADIVAALYGRVMDHRPGEPSYAGRDKFLYSKGHAAIAQYAALAETGYFPREELKTIKELGSRLQGHPDCLRTPGVEVGTGSLGQGLSLANGLALAMRLDGVRRHVFCLMGDGEIAEGQIWEAAMAAAYYRLDNLVGILDKNRIQATGPCCERFATDPLPEKWAAFGWRVLEADGHDVPALLDAFAVACAPEGGGEGGSEGNGAKRPTIVIAHTVKGKGVSFAEDTAAFHNAALTREQYEQALAELDARLAELGDAA